MLFDTPLHPVLDAVFHYTIKPVLLKDGVFIQPFFFAHHRLLGEPASHGFAK